jgi:hypothetical protein
MRKAQAAMEFLMTYGWAILVVLVAIAALAYFGVLNPGRFLPESCTIGAGVACQDFRVSGPNATIVVRNGMGSGITAVVLSLDGAPCNTALDMADGESVQFNCTNITPAVTTATKYKGTITFAYTQEGGLAHTKAGTLTAKGE